MQIFINSKFLYSNGENKISFMVKQYCLKPDTEVQEGTNPTTDYYNKV